MIEHSRYFEFHYGYDMSNILTKCLLYIYLKMY